MARDKWARWRKLVHEAAGLIADADRQWWRPVKGHQRREEARRLLALAEKEEEAIAARAAEFREAAARLREAGHDAGA